MIVGEVGREGIWTVGGIPGPGRGKEKGRGFVGLSG